MQRIVVLGSSFGGITAAYDLRRILPSKHEVVLISNSSIFVFRPSLPWVALGVKEPSEITADFTKGLAKRGIRYLQATVESIDPAAQVVWTTRGRVPYDYLVTALGAHLERDAVPGLDRHTECILWLDDAVRARRKLESFIGGDIILVEVQGSVVPCPIYEVALGLDTWLRQKGLRSKSRIHFITHQEAPFAIAGPKAARHVEREMRNAGIRLYLKQAVESVKDREIELSSGEKLHGDLIYAAPPYRGTDALLSSKGLTDRHGFVRVGRNMQNPEYPNVYAVGDGVAFKGPKSGRMAKLQAHVAAHNLAMQILGKGKAAEKRYKSHVVCIMELGAGRGLFAYRKESPGQGPMTFTMAFPGRIPHLAKAAFERYFLTTRF